MQSRSAFRAGAMTTLAVWTLAALCLAISPAGAADYYITDQSGTYIDFSGSGVGPGDTIYLVAHTRERLALKNLAGTAENPILITNTGGQFVMYNPNDNYETFRLINCQHVIVRGVPGDGYDYGIKVTNLPSTGKIGLYIVTTPTDIEIDSIEIGPVGGMGIMAKDEAASPPLVFDNLRVHDCYIHDTGSEGMYLGSSKWGNEAYNPEELHNCHVYNNLLVDCGWDGIQVGCGTENTQIYNNVILGYGVDPEAPLIQQDGIRGNPGFSGEIYNNWIESDTGKSGMHINPYNDTYIYNNVLVGLQKDGIYIGDDKEPVDEDTQIYIINNTIIEPLSDGIEFRAGIAEGNYAINNLIVDPGENYLYRRYPGVDITEVTNYYEDTLGDVGFTDAANGDYSLSSSATDAIDQGTDVSSYGVTFDFDGESRPYNTYYDIGAYEYLGGGGPTNQAPSVDAGSDDSITLPTDEVSLDGTVTDDGLPNPPGAFTVEWTKQSGPGTVTFDDDEAVDTDATFSAAGTYVLRLTASDSVLSDYDEVTITVNPQQGNGEWDIFTPVDWDTASGSDYCSANGAFDDQPTWDDQSEEPTGDDSVPNEDTDTNYANRYFYIDFGADYDELSIVGTWTRYRPYSGTSIYTYDGFPAMWWDDDVDCTNDGTSETTLNWETAAYVSHTDSQQWVQDVDCSASPITPAARYLVVSTGSSPSSRPNEFCIIAYTGTPNTAPTVDAGSDDEITLPNSVSLDGTVSDDGLPDPPAAVTVTWTKTSGPGTVTFGNANVVDTTADFSTDGTYVLRLTADDGDLDDYDEVTITVNPAPTITIITPVDWDTASGSDYCSANGAFDDQPTWDSQTEEPTGDDSVPNEDTDTNYANRYFYIDLGADYADIRITGTWTRYRPYSGTSLYSYDGFPAMWWDDDIDTTNDGTSETTLNWETAGYVSHIDSQQWVEDVNCSASPITPAGRYLVVSSGSSPSSRPNEFCIIGYTVD